VEAVSCSLAAASITATSGVAMSGCFEGVVRAFVMASTFFVIEATLTGVSVACCRKSANTSQRSVLENKSASLLEDVRTFTW
jgi:hypothetical protein